MPKQSTNHIMLIEPADFFANKETMDTNAYQDDDGAANETVQEKALREFREYQSALIEAGITVTTFKGDKDAPDQIFPNWSSTHEGGGIILYPMMYPSRQRERNPEMIEILLRTYDLWHDITDWENHGLFIESTSSLVMDRQNKFVYSALSKRTVKEAVDKWADIMDYKPITFETRSHTGAPVYHSDLVVVIGTEMAIICSDCIVESDRDRVLSSLKETHDVLEITNDQLRSFCGNALELNGKNGDRFLVMSDVAKAALRDDQKEKIAKYYDGIVGSHLPTMEQYGGGSARCMINELF